MTKTFDHERRRVLSCPFQSAICPLVLPIFGWHLLDPLLLLHSFHAISRPLSSIFYEISFPYRRQLSQRIVNLPQWFSSREALLFHGHPQYFLASYFKGRRKDQWSCSALPGPYGTHFQSWTVPNCPGIRGRDPINGGDPCQIP